MPEGVLFDEADRALIEPHTWYLARGGYPETNLRMGGKFVKCKMHRLLLGPAPAGCVVDHKNRRPLDNRRENLRFVTRQGNAQNTRQPGKSGYRGVHWSKPRQRWQTQVRIGGRSHYLGLYADLTFAATVCSAFRAIHMPDALD